MLEEPFTIREPRLPLAARNSAQCCLVPVRVFRSHMFSPALLVRVDFAVRATGVARAMLELVILLLMMVPILIGAVGLVARLISARELLCGAGVWVRL